MRWNNVWNTMSHSGPPSCFGKVWAFLITTHPALHCTQLTSLFLTQKPVPSASLSNNKGLDNVSVFDTLRMRSVCHTPPFTTASEPNNIQHKVCQVLCVSWDVVLFCRNMSGNEKALENLIFRNWNHFSCSVKVFGLATLGYCRNMAPLWNGIHWVHPKSLIRPVLDPRSTWKSFQFSKLKDISIIFNELWGSRIEHRGEKFEDWYS